MSDYIENPNDFDSNLRMGDVIEGFSHILPKFEDFFNKKNDFHLEIKPEKFFVVLTPCCSIEEKLITVVPLKRVLFDFFNNPYFVEDITRINKPMLADKSYPPDTWQRIPPHVQQQKMIEGEKYISLSNFIYHSNNKFPNYEAKKGKAAPIITNHYMIDFKDIFTVYSNIIQRGISIPKVLQLTIKARAELRNKLAFFYSRIPDEDLAT